MLNLKLFATNPDPKAISQTYELAKTPAFTNQKIRIMPDMHAGKGCVIGFTSTFSDKVIPNVVGVDIGCGVRIAKLMQRDIDFSKLDELIRRYIPSGFQTHNAQIAPFTGLDKLKCAEHLKNIQRIKNSLGTLGGGNHFIEIDENLCGVKYLIIHSGSRNLGKQIAEYYQNLAIEIHDSAEKIPRDLCYLDGDNSKNYLHEMDMY